VRSSDDDMGEIGGLWVRSSSSSTGNTETWTSGSGLKSSSSSSPRVSNNESSHAASEAFTSAAGPCASLPASGNMNESDSSSAYSSSEEPAFVDEEEEAVTRGRDCMTEFFNRTQRCKLKLSLLSTDRFSLERARVDRFEDWGDIVDAGVVCRWLEGMGMGDVSGVYVLRFLVQRAGSRFLKYGRVC